MSVRDITLEDTIDIKFTTRSFTTGAPTTLAGTPVVSAYPGNSTTQLTAGITLTVDFDTVTGLHNVRVVATAANGYAASTDYALVITTGTVGGVSVVGEVVGEFTTSRSASAVDLANGTDGLGAIKADTAAILVDTAVIGSTGQGLTSLATQASVNTIDGIVDDILVDTAVIGAAGVGLTAVALADATSDAVIADAVWNAATATYGAAGSYGLLVETDLDAAISSRLATAGYTVPDNTSIAAILVDTAEIGAAGAGLTALATAANLATVDTVADAIKVQTDKLTFTVANQVDANMQYINDTALTGNGSGTPWGPV